MHPCLAWKTLALLLRTAILYKVTALTRTRRFGHDCPVTGADWRDYRHGDTYYRTAGLRTARNVCGEKVLALVHQLLHLQLPALSCHRLLLRTGADGSLRRLAMGAVASGY